MKLRKAWLSLLLALAMVVTMLPAVAFAQESGEYTIIFHPNGGEFTWPDAAVKQLTYSVDTDEHSLDVDYAPDVAWEGHAFLGWFDAATGGNKVIDYYDDYVAFSGDADVYAQWREKTALEKAEDLVSACWPDSGNPTVKDKPAYEKALAAYNALGAHDKEIYESDGYLADLKGIDAFIKIDEAREAKKKAEIDKAVAERTKTVADAQAWVQSANAAKQAADSAYAAANSLWGSNPDDEDVKEAKQLVADANNAVAAANAAFAEAKAKATTAVTVNVKTVNAAAINKAIAAAGGDKQYVTKIVLGAKVKKISKNAFKPFAKVTNLEVKTKKLTKNAVKGSLKGSKVSRINVKVGSKKVNKKFVKKYKKFFTKKNAGKKAAVK